MWAEMFKALDKDHDGFVDIDELKDDMDTVLKGETRIPEEIMEETDTNGDGHVDFDGRQWHVSFNMIFIADSAYDFVDTSAKYNLIKWFCILILYTIHKWKPAPG